MLMVPDNLVTRWNIEIGATAAAAAWNTPCTFSQFDRVNVVTPEPLGSVVFLPVGWSLSQPSWYESSKVNRGDSANEVKIICYAYNYESMRLNNNRQHILSYRTG